MLAIRGAKSKIARELVSLLKLDSQTCRETVHQVGRGSRMPSDADRYFFCAGLLRPKAIEFQSIDEVQESLWVNCGEIVAECDRLLRMNPAARICVMGSESGISWSYDGAYAAARAALHRYIETKPLLSPEQQLVGVAPSIIGDSGMTAARGDTANLKRRETEHPKRRFVTSIEVARLIKFLLYEDCGYITGTVIRVNGGMHAWQR